MKIIFKNYLFVLCTFVTLSNSTTVATHFTIFSKNFNYFLLSINGLMFAQNLYKDIGSKDISTEKKIKKTILNTATFGGYILGSCLLDKFISSKYNNVSFPFKRMTLLNCPFYIPLYLMGRSIFFLPKLLIQPRICNVFTAPINYCALKIFHLIDEKNGKIYPGMNSFQYAFHFGNNDQEGALDLKPTKLEESFVRFIKKINNMNNQNIIIDHNAYEDFESTIEDNEKQKNISVHSKISNIFSSIHMSELMIKCVEEINKEIDIQNNHHEDKESLIIMSIDKNDELSIAELIANIQGPNRIEYLRCFARKILFNDDSSAMLSILKLGQEKRLKKIEWLLQKEGMENPLEKFYEKLIDVIKNCKKQ